MASTKVFLAGMGVMLIVLKPEVGVALVNTAAQGLGTVASAMATAVEKKPVREIEVQVPVEEKQPKSAIIEHRSVPNSELRDDEEVITPQEFDAAFDKKTKTYKGTTYTIKG